jgi:hypothetical protein
VSVSVIRVRNLNLKSSFKKNYKIYPDRLKVDFLPLLFQGFEMASLIHQR